MGTEMLFAVFGAYLLGSIPFGLILPKIFGLGDVRAIGSGNIGATNVLRTGNKWVAALTLLLDIGKGAAGVYLAVKIDPIFAPMAALAAFAGHVFPVWLKFKGGKGVATYVGALLALNWQAGLAALLLWIVMAAVFRYSSLSSLTAAFAGPFLVYFLGPPEAALWVLFMSAVIFYAHRENIKRLAARTEPKIGAKSRK